MPDPPGTRRRKLPKIKLGTSYFRDIKYRNGAVQSDSLLVDNHNIGEFSGTQFTVSEGHNWRQDIKAGRDAGGDFYTTITYLASGVSQKKHYFNKSAVNGLGQWNERTFISNAYAIDPNSVGPPSAMSLDNTALNAKGPIAIDRTKPTNSVADSATFLGELLKDGLPSIPLIRNWETATKLAVKAGDEFLNLVFGWEPLKADIRKSAQAIVNAQTILRQFERDAGRVVRRRYYFPTEKSTTTTLVDPARSPWTGLPLSTFANVEMIGTGPLWRTQKTVKKTWFSGAFTYHLPSGYVSTSDMTSAASKARVLLGLDLDPETLWNLAPWSWAVDWVTNAGSVLSNLSDWSKYGLVLKYGYMMEETTISDTYTLTPSSPLGLNPAVAPVSLVTITKKRSKANPFGFGVSWDGLNSIQLAILGALGITRSH